MKRLFVILSLAASAIVFNSCGPSRNTVAVQPVAPVYERPVSPGPDYVWVDGDWGWHGGRYVYTNGYWVRPQPQHVWVAGTWVQTNKGYYWKKGYWKK
jgi:hypothetical protein